MYTCCLHAVMQKSHKSFSTISNITAYNFCIMFIIKIHMKYLSHERRFLQNICIILVTCLQTLCYRKKKNWKKSERKLNKKKKNWRKMGLMLMMREKVPTKTLRLLRVSSRRPF